MSKQIMAYMKNLEKAVKKNAGEDVWLLVQEQVGKIKENTKLVDVAKRVGVIINTLINNVDDKVFLGIMKDRGCDCALSRMKEIEKQKSDYKKKGSLAEYINFLVEARTKGFYYYREENKLYLVYKPGVYNIKCYCLLIRKLPDGDLIPLSYCECSRSFIQFTWERILDRHVDVELVDSCLSGKKNASLELTYKNPAINCGFDRGTAFRSWYFSFSYSVFLWFLLNGCRNSY